MQLKTTTLWASALIVTLALVLATVSILLSPEDGLNSLEISLATEALLAICAIAALQFLRGRAADIAAIASTVREISDGQLDTPAPAPSRWQELATLGAAVETLRQSQREQARLKAESAELVALAEAARAQMAALSHHQCVIEFDLQGVVVQANANFCRAMGYDPATISGHRHSEFVDPDYARSPDYDAFWRDLRAGKLSDGEVRRRTRTGETKWLSASYNPIFDSNGKVVRIIKFATDITQRREAFDQIGSALVRLSEGDLTARVPDDTIPEFSGLRDAFNATMERLQAMVSDISTTCDAMASESDRISRSAAQLSERSDGQAAAVQETSAAVEEIAATIRQNAANAAQAETAAGEMAQRADAGARILEDAVGAMGRIEKSSDQISDIISVIESIAFQTNLLALNAAVEAARAGDAGKGFAVVASEVRTLAQRSSTAAKDISDLIRDATAQIASGSLLVRQSGQAFAEINANVSGVVTSVTEISNASREQAAGVTEISTAIAQIDGTTQENANLSDQSAANARTLVDKTNDLRQLVSFFRGGSRPGFIASAPAYDAHAFDTPMPRAAAAPAPRSAPRSSAATAVALDDWQDF